MKLTERVSKRCAQASKDDSSPRWRPGKEKVSDADAAAAEKELGYQTPRKDLNGLYHQSNSESGGDEHRKKLYVMYGGSSELVSQRDVKTLHREVFSVKQGAPKDRLARLSILILSKTYPLCGILSQVTRLMKALGRF
jgi:hypothetical protein